MGAAILENMPVTRFEDSTLFREISREISRFVLTERPLAWDFAKFRAKCYGRTHAWYPFLDCSKFPHTAPAPALSLRTNDLSDIENHRHLLGTEIARLQGVRDIAGGGGVISPPGTQGCASIPGGDGLTLLVAGSWLPLLVAGGLFRTPLEISGSNRSIFNIQTAFVSPQHDLHF